MILNTTFLVFLATFSPCFIYGNFQNNYQRNNIESIITDFTDDAKYLKAEVEIGKIKLFSDIAITELQKQKGLAIKDSLNENQSMMFLFPSVNKQSFWMKDMRFPIDILWIDENDKIVHIEHSLSPCERWTLFCTSYQPDSNSLYVLETVSGLTDKYDIKEGDVVYFRILDDEFTKMN